MTVGAIINHMSTDPENLVNMIEYTHYTWAIPYQVSKDIYIIKMAGNMNIPCLIEFIGILHFKIRL